MALSFCKKEKDEELNYIYINNNCRNTNSNKLTVRKQKEEEKWYNCLSVVLSSGRDRLMEFADRAR